MSHKLVSNSSVVYNAQTQASSSLTITPNSTNFMDNDGRVASGAHTVNINGTVWANYGLVNQTQVSNVGFTLSDTEWDTFYDAQTLNSTGSYDNIVETALLYIKDNVGNMYGLTSSDWTVSAS